MEKLKKNGEERRGREGIYESISATGSLVVFSCF